MKLSKYEKKVLDAVWVEVLFSDAYRPGIYGVRWRRKVRAFRKLIKKLKKL